MEGGQLGACLPSFLVPDHYAFPLPLPPPLQLPSSQPNNKPFQMPFDDDQEEAGNHAGMFSSSDHCGLYPLQSLPFGSSCSGGARGAAACGGKPTAVGFMPSCSAVGAEEVR